MDTNEALDNYINGFANLNECFGNKLYHEIQIHDTSEWTDYGDEHQGIAWEPQGEGDNLEMTYSCEIKHKSRWLSTCGLYTTVVAKDGCGGTSSYIFKNSLKLECEPWQ